MARDSARNESRREERIVSARSTTYVVLLVSLLLALMLVFAAVIYAIRVQAASNRDVTSARNAQRVVRTLQGSIDYLEPRARDWAQWDDSYAFIVDRSDAFMQSNLTPNLLSEIDMSALVFLDTKDGVVWGRIDPSVTEAADASTDVLLAELAANTETHPDTGLDGTGGMIRLHGVPFLFASQPITRSDGGGSIRGSVIMARALLPASLAQLSDLADAEFSTHMPDDPSLPEGLLADVPPRSAAPGELDGRQLTVPGYAVILGIDGSPLMVIDAREAEEPLGAGARGIAILMTVLLVVGIGWGAATLTLVERTSLARMSWLRQSVAGISAEGTPSGRINVDGSPTHDDVWAVAVEVNNMLSALEASEQAYDAIQEFFAKASHELRTPLNSVIGFSSILSRGMAGPLNEEQQRQVDMILSAGTHLLALTNDLLDVEKLQNERIPLDIEACDLQELARSSIATVRPMADEKGLELQLIDSEPVIANLDCRRIQQALFNVLGNAIKFTNSGSVSVRVRTRDEWAIIDIADTGRGIPSELLPRIFDKFVGTIESETPTGTGLGLTISKQIMERHGGRIDVVTEPDVGSTFSMLLPIEPPTKASEGD